MNPEMRERKSYYIAGLGACAMGLAALGYIMTDGRFALTAFVLLTLGFGVSWRIRTGRLATHTVDAVTLVILLPALAAVLIVPGYREMLFPSQALETTDLTMAVVLAWLMVACSFRLTSDVAVLFLCVPSLSLIGLAATFEPGSEMMTYFVVFLALGCFVLVRENVFLHQDRMRDRGGVVTVSAASIKVQIGVTASVVLAALIVGIGLGTLLYPALVRAVSPRIAPFEVVQLVESLIGEEYVPVATGPVNLSDQELMLVRCNSGLLWRGRVFNRYNGDGWASDIPFDEQAWISPFERKLTPDGLHDIRRFRIPDPPHVRERRETQPVEQRFTVVSGMYHTVFAAAEPKTVVFEGSVPLMRLTNRLESQMLLSQGISYRVTSLTSRASPRQLSAASRVYPTEITVRYLGVPETCWQVQGLTQRITAGLGDPYRKAMAIEDYLESRYTYDTKVPRAPEHEDAVVHFLFKSRRGYCDIFSSAMVIMARQAGIPARWVTGFATGTYNADDRAYHVQSRDRHAWAELYFPGYGWIAFDATPAAEVTTLLDRLRGLRWLLNADKQTILAALLVIGLIAYLVKTELIDRLRTRTGSAGRNDAPASLEVTRHYRKMCEIMARSGYPRHPSTTPWEYSERVATLFAPQLEPISATLDTITSDFVEFRYSTRQAPPDRITAMSDSIRALARSLKDAGRKKLLPRR